MQAGIVAAGRTSALDSGNAIARAADGFDHVRRIVHRFAQAFDVHVDRAFFNGYVVAPDAIQQLGAAVHAFCMLHQIVQQLEFGRAQMDGPIGVLHAVRCGVEREIAKRDVVSAASGVLRRKIARTRARSSLVENGLLM